MIKPVGLTHGHYECRSLKATLPILRDILAFEIVKEAGGNVIMKHPNTGWLLVVHEGGPNAPDKPRLNHYGVRVATNQEVDNAREYLLSKQSEYGLLEVDKLQNRHLAHSVHFIEPGGNTWEIESYELAVKAGLGANVSVPWQTPLPPERFPGRGYIPQALTHGTLENDDLETSERFYREALGLEVVKLWPSSCYVKHPDTPWYIVCIHAQNANRRMLSRYQRFTMALASQTDVHAAHREFTANRENWKLQALEQVCASTECASFQFADLNGNWWEITNGQA